MTPTPAQIEAAADAMIDCMFAPHELPLDGELQGKYYETAKAALTAAAEVGYGNARTQDAIDNMLNNPAAAEVDLPTAQDVKGIMRDDWLHPATIERCAQVCDDGTECGAHYAAAIRALKDK